MTATRSRGHPRPMARRSQSRSAEPALVVVRRTEPCRACRAAIAPGEQARYDPADAAHTCVLCIDDGLRVLGGDGGSPGCRSLAGDLDRLRPHGVLALHHRRLPEGDLTVDHLAVTANGIWVLDARRAAGPLSWRSSRTDLRTRLLVNRRDETRLLLRLDRLVLEVRRVLFEHDVPDVRIRAALCFVDTEVRLRQRPLLVDGRLVTWGRALRKPLLQPGPVDEPLRADVHRILAAAFPPAC
jgi:hypothetical protein